MTRPVKHTHKGEPMWRVERAEDCPDDFMVLPLDWEKYVAVRIEPYNPHHPVESSTRAYAELICNLLNSGVNDANWVPASESTLVPSAVRKKLKKAQKKRKKEAK